MSRMIRVAMTETRNAYGAMPAKVAQLDELEGRLEEVRAANVAHHQELIAEAASLGAQLVGLGELFTGPYFALEERVLWRGLSEDALDGPTITALRECARAEGVALVAPIYERCSRSARYFNTAVVIGADGEVLGRYRKTHIPAGRNEQGSFHETAYYEASDGELGAWPRNLSQNPFFPVFDLGFCRLGIAICYDRHFAGAMQALARNGAQLVLSPAVTFGATSRRMWELEFPVDAARQRIYIGGSNRSGSEAPWGQEYFGGSYFCGPQGRLEPLASRTELVIADLDLALLEGDSNSGWDLERDARDEIFEDR